MPYIEQAGRDCLDPEIDALSEALRFPLCREPGALNYTITTLLCRVLGDEGWSYKKINTMMGVLECVKQEMYRRVAAEYEDEAILRNGDLEEFRSKQ